MVSDHSKLYGPNICPKSADVDSTRTGNLKPSKICGLQVDVHFKSLFGGRNVHLKSLFEGAFVF